MRRVIALSILLFAFSPAYCADREGPRDRERDAAWQTLQRQHVIERYRYRVPVSAFAQRRSDDPRAHARWLPYRQPTAPEPMW